MLATKYNQDNTFVFERNLMNRPAKGLDIVETIYDILYNQPVVELRNNQLYSESNCLLGSIKTKNSMFSKVIEVFDTRGQLVAVIEMGRQVKIKIPSFDLMNKMILIELGSVSRKVNSTWRLSTHIRDPDHWSRMIDVNFAESDGVTVTDNDVQVGRITRNSLYMDTKDLRDDRQRSVMFAFAISRMVK